MTAGHGTPSAPTPPAPAGTDQRGAETHPAPAGLTPERRAHLEEVAKRPDSTGDAARQRIVAADLQTENDELRALLRRVTEHCVPSVLTASYSCVFDAPWNDVRLALGIVR